MASQSKVDLILNSIYNEVYILEDWINSISCNVILPQLIQSQDSQSYTRLLKTSKVCVKSTECRKQISNRLSPSQNFHQQEIIMRVIERILKKDERSNNVMVLGFSLKSDSPDARVSMTTNIQHNYPNSGVIRLQYSSWCLLLSRIGDNIMSYLLENTSIFLQIADTSCYVQVTGEGIHDLVIKQKDKTLTSAKSKQPYDHNISFKRKQIKKLKKRVNKKSFTTIKLKNANPSILLESNATSNILYKQEPIIREQSNNRSQQLPLPETGIPFDIKPAGTRGISSSVDHLHMHQSSPTSSNVASQVDEFTCLSYDYIPKELSCKTDHQQSPKKIQTSINSDTHDSNVTYISENHQQMKPLSELAYIMQVSDENNQQTKLQSSQIEQTTDHTSVSDNLNISTQQISSGNHQQIKVSPSEIGKHSADNLRISSQQDPSDSHQLMKVTCSEIEQQTTHHISVSDNSRILTQQLIEKNHQQMKDPPSEIKKQTLDFSGSNNLKISPQQDHPSNNYQQMKVEIERLKTEYVSDSDSVGLSFQQVLVEVPSDVVPTSLASNSDLCQISKTAADLNSGSGTLFESSESSNSKDGVCVFGLNSISQEQPLLKLKHEQHQNPVIRKCYSVLASSEELISSSQDFHISNSKTLASRFQNHQGGSFSQEHEAGLDKSKSTSKSTLKRKRSLSLSDLRSIKIPRLNSKLTQTVSVQNDQKIKTSQNDFKPYNFHQSIRRVDILCCKSVREKIPKLGSVEEIYNSIVSKAVGCKTPVDHSAITTSLKPLLETLLIQYQKCPWFTLLNYYCPANKYSTYRKKTSRKKKKTKSTAKLLESFAPHDQVYLFLKIITKKIIPYEVFGSIENKNIFLKNVFKYIKLGRYEGLCLGEVMTGIKIKSCLWLKNIKCPTTRSHILSQVFLWLFDDFIAVIFKSFFYITESNNYRNRIFYYRKSIWQQLYLQSFQAFKVKCHLKPISMSEVEKLLRLKKALGIGHLKFLPKVRSCRPIINMGKNLNFPGIFQTIPINKQLLNLLHVLTSYKDNHPNVVGSSVFGPDDVYNKLKQFIQYRNLHSDTRELYFVKTDITNCFDTIRPKKIYNIMSHLVNQRNEEFITRKYFCVFTAGGKIRRSIHRNSQSLSDYNPDFFSFSKQRIHNSNLRNLIFVDMVVNDHNTPCILLNQLHCLLFNNIIKVGRVYYKQEGGISQGSSISTLLSNYYYGDMEKEMMSITSDELLMRMVDDFLYITPYKHKAVQFLTNIWKGNEEYNCYVNPDKIMTNFTCILDDKTILPSDKEEFCWCGYEINTTSLNISGEYERHQALDVKDMMTIETGLKPGLAMKNKLMLSVRPKCHSLFLDEKINSEATIVRNISELFKLTAVKFHCYHRKLPHKQRSNNNTAYFYNMILSLCSYMNSQGKLKLSKLYSCPTQLSLSLLEITWIGICSFIKQLSVYHSQYHLLLKSLRSKFKSASNKLGKKRKEELEYIVHKYKFISPLINQ